MTDTARLTVKELAEGLFSDSYFGDDGTVNRLISKILHNVAQENWPTKHFGPHFKLVLTWIAWNHTTLPTYIPGSGEVIPPQEWEKAFKGYKVTIPKIIKAGHKRPFEFLDAEVKKEELETFLIRCELPLPCPKGAIPSKWFCTQNEKAIVSEGQGMGKLWLTGHDLLKDKYQGQKKKFFDDIGSGVIVPCNNYGERYGTGRIYPDNIKPILGKIAILEELQGKLGNDDEALLRGHFYFKNDTDDEDAFKSYAESEEGRAARILISSRRPEWKEDFDKLLAEIGDYEQKLAPSVVWRGVDFSYELQEKLLNASYPVNLGNDEAELTSEPPALAQLATDTKPASTKNETPPEMFSRLKAISNDDKDIARKIKTAFPTLSDANLGKLFYLPNENVSHDAHRKKGQRLLDKAK